MKAMLVKVGLVLTFACLVAGQACNSTCQLPDCSCPRFTYPMDKAEIPQMVYFAFDDVESSWTSQYYDKIFTSDRRNPNNCTMKMTLYATSSYSHYDVLIDLARKGMEIGMHGINGDPVRNASSLLEEASKGRKFITDIIGLSTDSISGWRSPSLRTVGDDQPRILNKLGYEYDISVTYGRYKRDSPKPWPFTLDNGWPYLCDIPPCPVHASVSGFWQVPVISDLDFNAKLPCVYIDGCQNPPIDVKESFQYLWNNFMDYYHDNRAPFGLHMHATWLLNPSHFKAMHMFLDELQKLDDVYVLTVKQVLDWMKNPVPLSKISSKASWNC